jgi:DNA-binding MarR family transcriptional regulator
MTSKLQAEIKQSKPFETMREEVSLNLARTAAVLGHELERRLRGYGLSSTQYNVLRILRGAGEAGLCQYAIRDRLVAEVPDVPRILSRMEKARWIRRTRGTEDRRMMMATITQAGLELLAQMDEPVAGWARTSMTQLSEDQLRELNELLILARAEAT